MHDRDGAISWSHHDTAVWHACDIANALIAGRIHDRPVVATPFRPHLGPRHPHPDNQERVLAQGGFELLTHRPVGDGSYVHDGGFFLAAGRGGLGLSAGVLAGRAIGNARRRARAAADTVPRWVPDDAGTVWVSTHGFYLQTPRGLYGWPWAPIVSAQLVGPGALHVQGGESVGGPVSWVLRSDWAELVFVVWAMNVHPGHPQLVDGGWLPPQWWARCQAAGHASQRLLPALRGPDLGDGAR